MSLPLDEAQQRGMAFAADPVSDGAIAIVELRLSPWGPPEDYARRGVAVSTGSRLSDSRSRSSAMCEPVFCVLEKRVCELQLSCRIIITLTAADQ